MSAPEVKTQSNPRVAHPAFSKFKKEDWAMRFASRIAKVNIPVKVLVGLAGGAMLITATAFTYHELGPGKAGSPTSSTDTTQAFQDSAYLSVQDYEAEERLYDELSQSFIGIPASKGNTFQAWEVEELEAPIIGVPAPASNQTTAGRPSASSVKDPILIMEELREADRQDDERFMIQYWNELNRKADRAQMGGTPSRVESQEVVTGSGTIMEEITRTTEDLTPCPDDPTKNVQLAQRVGNAAFNGLISNSLADGQVQLRALVDPCADPTQGPFTIDYSLDDATVAGLTGELKIQVTALTSGSVLDPGGAKSMGHFTIQGVSGELKHAQGQGLIVSHATSTSSFRAYYAEIRPR
jgi:hypothetical protein